jgi:hypothetical protein
MFTPNCVKVFSFQDFSVSFSGETTLQHIVATVFGREEEAQEDPLGNASVDP